ncbi:MAG TPA: tetratricopeptide repeat protein [Rhizomicrobium sp.]|jgi:lipoprotein NlpI|nr:tetratricopeptide repeat protein [Rhizomicrobium sp.]
MRFRFIAIIVFCLAAVGYLAYDAARDRPQPRCDSLDATSAPGAIKACTALLQTLSASDGYRTEVLINRGIDYDMLGQYDLAMADFNAAIKLKPKLGAAYRNRAVEWHRKGDYAAAVADYDEALRLDPSDVYALYGRGVTRIKAGDTANGKADIAAANAQGPEAANVYTLMKMQP